ncbi:MAG: RpiB/LacA/LacB family sugar-phosphate isomerase [bacterium]|nr:RpiB/LacA/LacB family sugar-phosphate isomerase [bacterium]
MKIGIANDHRGYPLKQKIKKYLVKKGYEVIDYGTNAEESVDYTEYAFKIGEAVVEKEVDYGIVICGTGIGISIACNKVKGVRCAKVDNERQAKLTRMDNDANIIALDGSMVIYKALDIIDTYLKTPYSNLDKHNRRLTKIKDYEESQKRNLTKEETTNEC